MSKTINERIKEIEDSTKLKQNEDYYHSDCVDLDDYIELAQEALFIIKKLQKELNDVLYYQIDTLGEEVRKSVKLNYGIEI